MNDIEHNTTPKMFWNAKRVSFDCIYIYFGKTVRDWEMKLLETVSRQFFLYSKVLSIG